MKETQLSQLPRQTNPFQIQNNSDTLRRDIPDLDSENQAFDIMRAMDEVRREQSKTEDYIITSCFTLLAALAIIFSIKKPTNVYISYSVVVSAFCIIISLLELLWHKSRRPLRDYFFEQKKKHIINEYTDKIANFAEKLVLPYTELLAEKQAKTNTNYDAKILQRKVFEENKDSFREVLRSFVRNLSNDMKKANDSTHNKPLKEKFSKLKCFIDIISKKTRIHFFVLGALFFFLAILLSLF